MPPRFIAYENLIAAYFYQAKPINTAYMLDSKEYNHDVAEFIFNFLKKMIDYNLTPEDILIGLRGLIHD